jgi:RNA polymerase sigma-70 factor (ECF subfamily)
LAKEDTLPVDTTTPRDRRDGGGERDDAALMRAIAGGDSSALEALYDRYSGLVYSLCLRIVRDRADADEVLVDIFWELWDKAGRYDAARSKPVTYLMRLTRSRAIDRRRAKPKLRTTELEPASAAAPQPAASAMPEGEPSLSEARAAVARSLAQLEEGQRKAIEYSFWDDLSHNDIAIKLNKPLGTVKTWIRTGLSKLKFSLKEFA